MFYNSVAKKIFKDYRNINLKKGLNFKAQLSDQMFKERDKRIYERLRKGEVVDYTKKVDILNKPRVLNPIHKLIKDEKGTPLGYLEYVKDLTLVESLTADVNTKDVFLKHILEATNNSYIAYDLDHKILFFNASTVARHKEFLGSSLKVGQSIIEAYGEERFEERYKKVFESLKSGKKVESERREFFAGDKKLILEINFSPIYDVSGSLIGVLEDAADITEADSKTKLLIEKTATLNALLDSTGEGIYATNENLEIIYTNKAAIADFKNNLGIDIKEGAKLKELINVETIKRWKESYFDKVFKGEVVTYSGFLPDSENFVQNSYIPVKDDKGKVLACLEVSKDLTEIQEYKKLIKDSENQYRTLINAIPTGIIKLNLNGEFTYVSPAASRILDDRSSFILNKSITEFVHPDDHEKLTKNLKLLYNGARGSL